MNTRVKARFTLLSLTVLLFAGMGCGNRPPVSAENQKGSSDKPTVLPSIRLYSDQSPLNQTVPADAEIDPDTRRYVDAIVQRAGDLVIQVKHYSSPVYFSDSGTPRHDVSLACGTVWELGVTTLKNVPIPDFAEPANDLDTADDPIPIVGCGEESDQDNSMVIIDLDSRCEYDLWQARREDGRWVCSWGNAISIDGGGVYEKGLSARGSGFAFLAGVIWPNELRQGVIHHALLFNLPNGLVRAGGPVPPATESDGESTDQDALPEGARLRLDPTLDLNTLSLTPAERTIAVAMQTYGMFLTDRGGGPTIGLYAVAPRSVRENPYAGLLPDEDFPDLAGIPLDKFQVLKLPRQDTDFQQKLALPVNGCATFQ